VYEGLGSYGTGGLRSDVRISVDAYSSDEEYQQLVGILKSDGYRAFLKQLKTIKTKGRASVSNGQSGIVRVVHKREMPGGKQHIVMFSDQLITCISGWGVPLRGEDPVSLIVLDLEPNGEGAGVIHSATEIKVGNNGQLQIERYAARPCTFSSIRKR